MKESYFAESLIKYEALTATPLKDEFGSIQLDKQVELLDGLIADVAAFAAASGLPHPSRKSWNKFKMSADWTAIAKDALMAKTFVGKVKKKLDKVTNLW